MRIATTLCVLGFAVGICAGAQAAPKGSIKCASEKMTAREHADYAAAIRAHSNAQSDFIRLIVGYAAECGKVNKWTDAQEELSSQYASASAFMLNERHRLQFSDSDMARIDKYVADQGDKLSDVEHFTPQQNSALLNDLHNIGVGWSDSVATNDDVREFIYGTYAVRDFQTKFDAS